MTKQRKIIQKKRGRTDKIRYSALNFYKKWVPVNEAVDCYEFYVFRVEIENRFKLVASIYICNRAFLQLGAFLEVCMA